MGQDRQSLYFNEADRVATPYQRARQQWDDRIGSARVQAANWRIMAFLLLALICASWGIILWQMQTSRITPYIVEVTSNGSVRTIGSASQTYQPRDEQIAFHLSQFITHIRSLPADPIVVRKNWIRAYAFVTSNARTLLSDYARKNDPFTQVGKRTVSVDILSVVRASKDSFQIRWEETTYVKGSLESNQRFTALLTLHIKPPKTEELLKLNPLGIWISELNWSTELKTGKKS